MLWDAKLKFASDILEELLNSSQVTVLALAPADGQAAVESKESWGRTALDNLSKCGLVLGGRLAAVGWANPPIHAPTAVAGAFLAEQVFKGRP
jgi:hypothetical protein